MHLGYLAIGTLIGSLAALAIAISGAGVLLALCALSGIGTVSTLAAMVAGAACPRAKAAEA